MAVNTQKSENGSRLTTFFHVSQRIASRQPPSPNTFYSDFVLDRNAIFESLVDTFPTKKGKDISKKERNAKSIYHSSLTYGEIDFKSFARTLERVKTTYGVPGNGSTPDGGILQSPGGIFYDLGSGTGKACVAAALLHPFSAIGGIEVLEGLHAMSVELAHEYMVSRTKAATEEQMLALGQPTRLDFYLGDATDFSASNRWLPCAFSKVFICHPPHHPPTIT